MRLNILIFLLIVMLILTTEAAEAGTWSDFTYNPPVLNGNTITDHNNYTYNSGQNGIYQINYGNGKSIFFGFALSGTVSGNNFVRYTSDYSWVKSISESTDTIDVSAKNTDGNWITNFTFTPYSTKITNTLTNTLSVPITNAKFYYIFSVAEGDIVRYNDENRTVPANPDLHVSGDLTANFPALKLNGNMIFDFQDLIDNGFIITDFYIKPASSLGINYNGNIAAIGFTKNGGVFPAGATVEIDPTLTNGDFESGAGGWIFSGNGSYAVVSPGYGGSGNIGKVSLTSLGTVDQLYQYGFTLEPNTAYRFSIVANSTAGSNIDFNVQRHSSPYTNYGLDINNVNLTTDLQQYTYYFTTTGFSSTTTDTRLSLYIGSYGATLEKYYFDDISLEKYYIPPSSTTLSSSQGNFWVNNTWAAGLGNTTDLFNISVNGSWVNGSTALFYNSTGMAAHGWSNISVYAYNSSGTGTVNTTPASQNTQLVNTAPVLTNTTNITVSEGEMVTLDFGCTDSELDTCTYSLNRSDLFPDFSIVTGAGTWKTSYDSNGIYALNAGVDDGYGGAQNATVMITVNNVTAIPPVPTTLTNTTGTNWFRYAWIAGSGNITDSYNVNLNGTWTNHTTDAFLNTTGMAAHAWANISVYAYNATGIESLTALSQNTQLANTAPVLINTTNVTVNEGETVSLDFGCTDSDLDTCTYSVNRTDLFADFSTVTGAGTWLTTFSSSGVYALDVGVSDGYGGIGNATVTITVNDVIQAFSPPAPETLSSSQSNFWVNHTWVAGLGNVTDLYNVSINGSWINGSIISFYNSTSMNPHGWSNISVFAFNSSGTSTLNTTPASQNIQIANNAPTLLGVNATYYLLADQTLTIDANFTDLDLDAGSYTTNASLGSINSSTGVYTYNFTSVDFGVYVWNISVNDGNGSIVTQNFTVTISNNSVPSISASSGSLAETSAIITSITNQTDAISYILYSTSSTLISATKTTNQTSGLTRNDTLSGLSASTTYYYTVFALNSTNASLFTNTTIANFTTSAAVVVVSGGGGGGGVMVYVVPKVSPPLVTISQINSTTAMVKIKNEGLTDEEYVYSVELRDWQQATVSNFIRSKLVKSNETFSFPVSYNITGLYNIITRVRYSNGIYMSEGSLVLRLGEEAQKDTPTNMLKLWYMTAFLFLKTNVLILISIIAFIVILYIVFQYKPKPERKYHLRMPLK